MNKQKIYISGKITGLSPEQVSKKFEAAEVHLTINGFDPINPVKLEHSGNTSHSWDKYMRTDLKALLDCDTIYMLPCWRNSNGAKVELQLAISLNYNIIWAQ